MSQRIVQNETRATQGSKEGVVRYVLIASIALAVIAMAVSYKLFF